MVMRRHFIAAAAAGLLLTGVSGCARPVRNVPSEAGGAAAAGTATTEIYVVPAAARGQDGTLYTHGVGSPASSDVAIGKGTDVVFVPASAAGGAVGGHLQWFSTSSGSMVFSGLGAAGAADVMGNAGTPLTSLDLGNTRYVQTEADVVATSGGRIVATYPLPVLQPDPDAGQFPVGYKGIYTGVSAGVVTALVPTAAGHVLAFTSTGLAAAVTDLMTGRTVALRGFGTLGSAGRTSTGQLVVLAWRGNDETYAMRVVMLDMTDLAVVATLSTGLAPTSYLRDRLLIGSGHDAVVSIARGDETAGVSLTLFTVDANRLAAGPKLPTNIGLEVAPQTTGRLYVYGGPAKNTVSELDLVTGALTRDVPELRAPTGSYVVGIGAD
jgi:hypothetical protein